MSKHFNQQLEDDDSSEVVSFLENKGRSTTYMTNTNHLHNPKLNYSSSLRTLSQFEESEISSLKKENKLLRKEIDQLKKQVKGNEDSKPLQYGEMLFQNARLKSRIQKVLLSMQKVEEENRQLKKQFKIIRDTNQHFIHKIGCLEKLKVQLIKSEQQQKKNHCTEIELVWERVASLQNNLEAIVLLIEEDKKQWRKWREDNERIKSGSSKRSMLASRLKSYA